MFSTNNNRRSPPNRASSLSHITGPFFLQCQSGLYRLVKKPHLYRNQRNPLSALARSLQAAFDAAVVRAFTTHREHP